MTFELPFGDNESRLPNDQRLLLVQKKLLMFLHISSERERKKGRESVCVCVVMN